MSLGNDIQKYRKEKKLTQLELAKRAGLSEISIRKYENGDRKPKIEAVQKIAEALDISPYSLYSFEMAAEEVDKKINQKEKKEDKLLNNYKKLNNTGQEKLIDYAEDLATIPKYQKKEK